MFRIEPHLFILCHYKKWSLFRTRTCPSESGQKFPCPCPIEFATQWTVLISLLSVQRKDGQDTTAASPAMVGQVRAETQEQEQTVQLSLDSSSMLDAIADHIRLAVQSELARVFPTSASRPTQYQGGAITAIGSHSMRPTAAASTWTPQNHVGGLHATESVPQQAPNNVKNTNAVKTLPGAGLGPATVLPVANTREALLGKSLFPSLRKFTEKFLNLYSEVPSPICKMTK